CFFFQAEDGIRDRNVTGVQTCALPISLRAEQLKDAKKLKWIHSTAAGVAQLMYPELRDSGILVTNPSGIFSVPMAEHTMGLLLALARNFPDCVRLQDRARWSQQELWDKPQHLTE